MPELTAALETIRPELMNVTRLFGLPESVWDEPVRYRMSTTETPEKYIVTFKDGTDSATGEAEIPSDPDPRVQALHRRRAARRLCKQTLYDLCRKTTGIHPPWGSMTGVRPTHLMLEALAEGLSPEDAVNRMVDRFDVLRPKAELLAEIALTQRKLPAPGDRWIDVYIGIPFCTTRCAYCSFSSGEIGNGRLVPPYMDALEKEIRGCAEILRRSGRTLRALYVGGGTPTALPEDDFRRLMALIAECFPGALEYTVEAGRPDTITREKLRAVLDAGVRRLSINPQTMNDRTLRVIGRAHTAAQVVDAYRLAREEGIPHINMDVIAGLPGENEEDGEMTARMVAMGMETARSLSLVPYYMYRQKYMAGNLENTGYALPGHACLYNVDMMEETSHVLAMGAGGISKRIWPEEGHITRAPNVSNIEEYIRRTDEMLERKREIFPEA